jgi:hypothetical protein
MIEEQLLFVIAYLIAFVRFKFILYFKKSQINSPRFDFLEMDLNYFSALASLK